MKSIVELMNLKGQTELPFYNHLTQQLSGSQVRKAQKLIELDCVKEVELGRWAVLPIAGYNSRTYSVNIDGPEMTCNCQFQHKTGALCSHILAVLMKKNEE